MIEDVIFKVWWGKVERYGEDFELGEATIYFWKLFMLGAEGSVFVDY